VIGEEHYNIISAMHKAVRGSDADAALYWMGRMLQGGEDPKYVARRLIRIASEDVGLADPTALPLAVAAFQAVERVGMPECDMCLAQCVVHLARAPKSVEVYKAYNKVKEYIKTHRNEPVPFQIRNAPRKAMAEWGYGEGYLYNPDYAHKSGEELGQSYLPDGMKHMKFLDERRSDEK